MKRLIQFPAEFDHNILLNALDDYKKPKDKIRALVKSGDIIRVKKGLYVLGKEYNKPYNRYVLANLIYGPSYVTGQTALAFWNLIPERVELVISMTMKRKKQFETPVGRFSYWCCPKEAFNIGIELKDTENEKKCLMACPEKALCDVTASQTQLKTSEEMNEFLDLMRLDPTFYDNMNFPLLEKIAAGYHKKRLKLLIYCLKENHV